MSNFVKLDRYTEVGDAGSVWVNADHVTAVEPKTFGSLVRTVNQQYQTTHDAVELIHRLHNEELRVAESIEYVDGSDLITPVTIDMGAPPMTEVEHAALLASFEVEPPAAPAKKSAARKRAAKRS